MMNHTSPEYCHCLSYYYYYGKRCFTKAYNGRTIYLLMVLMFICFIFIECSWTWCTSSCSLFKACKNYKCKCYDVTKVSNPLISKSIKITIIRAIYKKALFFLMITRNMSSKSWMIAFEFLEKWSFSLWMTQNSEWAKESSLCI